MTDESYVFLAVLDFGPDPAVVTNLIRLTPTKAWVRRESLPNHPRRWTFQSPLPLPSSPEEHLDALLLLLEPHADGIRRCSKQFRTLIWCAIYYADFTPVIRLSQAVLRRITQFGVDLDFDLYFLGDD